MKKFTVIGLGNFGFHAAKALFEEGNEVIAIDTDRVKVQAIDPYATEAIVLDATDKEALRTLGLEEMVAVIVSTGTRISISIMICLYLNELGVKKILVKAIDPDHEKILLKVGATEVIHPERDMAIRVSRSLSRPNMLDFIPLSDDFDLIQIEPPQEFLHHRWRGHHFAAADLARQETLRCAQHLVWFGWPVGARSLLYQQRLGDAGLNAGEGRSEILRHGRLR
jgi:trk system potassium uptake protein TrkA